MPYINFHSFIHSLIFEYNSARFTDWSQSWSSFTGTWRAGRQGFVLCPLLASHIPCWPWPTTPVSSTPLLTYEVTSPDSTRERWVACNLTPVSSTPLLTYEVSSLVSKRLVACYLTPVSSTPLLTYKVTSPDSTRERWVACNLTPVSSTPLLTYKIASHNSTRERWVACNLIPVLSTPLLTYEVASLDSTRERWVACNLTPVSSTPLLIYEVVSPDYKSFTWVYKLVTLCCNTCVGHFSVLYKKMVVTASVACSTTPVWSHLTDLCGRFYTQGRWVLMMGLWTSALSISTFAGQCECFTKLCKETQQLCGFCWCS